MTWDLRNEVAIDLRREEIASINKEALRRFRNDSRVRWIFVAFVLLVALPAVAIVSLLVPPSFGQRFLPGLACFVTAVAFLVVTRPRYFRHVRRILRERGYDVCQPCGYVLQGLGSPVTRCPECGAKRLPLPQQSTLAS